MDFIAFREGTGAGMKNTIKYEGISTVYPKE